MPLFTHLRGSSTLAIWPPGRRHRSRVPCYSLDFLRLGAHRQPAKSLLTSWERPPHTRSAGYGCPKEVWSRAGPRGASERSFRGLVSFEERSGIGASQCPPREDGRGACPTLFGSKWLKSSEERLSGNSERVPSGVLRICSMRRLESPKEARSDPHSDFPDSFSTLDFSQLVAWQTA